MNKTHRSRNLNASPVINKIIKKPPSSTTEKKKNHYTKHTNPLLTKLFFFIIITTIITTTYIQILSLIKTFNRRPKTMNTNNESSKQQDAQLLLKDRLTESQSIVKTSWNRTQRDLVAIVTSTLEGLDRSIKV